MNDERKSESRNDACAESSCDCRRGIPRRTFIKVSGLGAAAAWIAGPPLLLPGARAQETGKDGEPLIPPEKNLDPEWVRTLFERGTKETFRGKELETIGMPCGGIGAGQLYLCGDGTLGCWMIFNNARSRWIPGTHSTYGRVVPEKPVDQGFAVVEEAGDGPPSLRPLSAEGFPEIEFTGEYPIGTVRYRDPQSPIEATLEAFSPFIPSNAPDSGLPATLFFITLKNVSDRSVSAGTTGWLENAVCRESGPRFGGKRRTRILGDDGYRMILHEAIPPPETGEERPDIVFADFGGADYGDWKAEGEAFGDGPVAGTLPGQNPVSGYLGKRLVNSYRGGDGPRGTLTSPPFVIGRSYINFLIGGGSHRGRTCMNLVVDGEVVRSATGRDSEELWWQSWSVRELEGREARIVVVDRESGPWGHILVDRIEFSDVSKTDGIRSLREAPDFGTMVLACAGPGGVEDEIAGRLPGTVRAVAAPDETWGITEKRRGVLRTRPAELAPGESATFVWVLAWHFPNGRGGHVYAERFPTAADAGRTVLEQRDRLAGDTRLWRDTWYDSTLPYWLLDRLHSTASCLATGTALWWRNGRFWANEGVECCPGTCTHVWNYAQTHARLFPELARSVREMQDFCPRGEGGGFHPDSGLVGFRSNDAYAADGQCGTILKAYREHLMSADDGFLRRNWPKIRKAMEFSIQQDGNADGLIEKSQHNTYDINYMGPNTFVGSLYLAALRASEEMAREVGDHDFAAVARAIYERGRHRSIERLWNGEYFIQDVDLKKHPKHQYGPGCLSDQMFGQGWAHQVGLGYLYPAGMVRSALRAVWKYNWAPDVGPYNAVHKPFRWFISPGQAGLLTCTWPKSEYLPEGTVYKNEVWTGIEYQVAGHMIREGMVKEGLAICRAIHERYHPSLLNPYNEVECGDHYARALASWGVFLALEGFEYHGPRGHIGFAPRISPGNFRAAFTSAEGWGSFSQKRTGNVQEETLEVRWGRLRLESLSFEWPEDRPAPRSAQVDGSGGRIGAETTVKGTRVELRLERPVVLETGERLEVRLA